MATATTSAPELVRVNCARCGRVAGILAGAVAWCWGAGLNRHPSRRMREVTP